MDLVAMVTRSDFVQRVASALISAANHREIGMLAKTLVPHLFRRIPTLAMDLFPLHPSLGRIHEITWGFWTSQGAKAHVRGDDGTPVDVLF